MRKWPTFPNPRYKPLTECHSHHHSHEPSGHRGRESRREHQTADPEKQRAFPPPLKSPAILHPTLETALAIHAEILAAQGGSPGLQSRVLLESALAAPLALQSGPSSSQDPVVIVAAYLFYLGAQRRLCGGWPARCLGRLSGVFEREWPSENGRIRCECLGKPHPRSRHWHPETRRGDSKNAGTAGLGAGIRAAFNADLEARCTAITRQSCLALILDDRRSTE